MKSQITFLHTNDLHGALNKEKYESLLVHRNQCDLYIDSGDSIKTGNLGIPTRQDPAWEFFSQLHCSAGTIGNRETHVVEKIFKDKIGGCTHPLLCSNMFDRSGNLVLLPNTILDSKGMRIGLFGVSVAMVTERMLTQRASAFLWEPPIDCAINQVKILRPECDLLIAITHIGLPQDRVLAQKCPEIDIIFGGHSHSVLQEPEVVNSVAICHGGSHGRFFGMYSWNEGKFTGNLLPWA